MFTTTKKWLLLLLFLPLGFLFFPKKPSPYEHEFAICAIFKNEARWLKEWIVYHHDILGAERFFLYNNDSTDNYEEVLKPFIDKGIVELIDWNSADESHAIRGLYSWNTDHSVYQMGAYKDCMAKVLGKVKWIAMIDIDEFIVPVNGVKSFYSILQRWERKSRGSVRMHWRVFGTSNVWDLEEGELLTEKLLWRSESDHPWNGLTKGIHRPEAVVQCCLHEAILKNEFCGSTPNPDKLLRVNHYWARTEKKCREKRGKAKEEDPPFFEAFSRVKDETILQYLPKLRQAMKKYENDPVCSSKEEHK